MKKFSNIQTAAVVAIIAIGISAIIPMLTSCTGSLCDGDKCKKILGFKEKPSERDSLFNQKNPLYASKFNVFVESSASMNGYVKGNTKFKTVLHRLIGQVIADVLVDDKSISLNYINSEIKPQNLRPKQFTQNLSPESFASAGGDIENSDIIEVISRVIKATNAGEVSMFVSDCVYSPQAAEDIDKALATQQTDMLNILKNKSKKDPKFSILVYRLVSDFHGIYYNKTNQHILCNGQRPYFIWFMGDESILANVHGSISSIMSAEKANYIAGIPSYKYIPYNTLGSDHPYHYISAKASEDSLFTFSFRADLSRLPLSQEYLTNIGNYIVGKHYFIKKIEPVGKTDLKDNKGYNYKYTICVRGRKNGMVTPTLVDISLKSMSGNLPQWVTAFDDPKGNDYNAGYNPKKLRTFGIRSLIDGIAEFYNEPSYVSFKIQIN